MKKLFILAVLFLLAVLTAGSMYAQNSIKADIPFAFTVVNKALPAGAYHAELRSTPQLLFLGESEKNLLAALTHAVEVALNQNVEPKFVFRRYGDQYFLAEVWWGRGNQTGRAIPRSVEERFIARKAPEPEWIYIAAK